MGDITLETLQWTRASEVAEKWYREVADLKDISVLQELSRYRLSHEGDIATRRHRLFRYGLRKTELADIVRWEPEKDEMRVTPRTEHKKKSRNSYSLVVRRPTLVRNVNSKYKRRVRNGEEPGQWAKDSILSGVDVAGPSGGSGRADETEATDKEKPVAIVVTTSSGTISTTTVTTATSTTTTHENMMMGLPKIPRLGFSKVMEQMQAEWRVRYTNLRTPARMTTTEDTGVNQNITLLLGGNQSEEKKDKEQSQQKAEENGVSQEVPKINENVSEEGELSESENEYNEDDEYNREEEVGDRNIIPDVWETLTDEELNQIKSMWLAEQSRRNGETKIIEGSKTVIQSKGGQGMMETPKACDEKTAKTEKKTRIGTSEKLGRIDRESTRREDYDIQEELSTELGEESDAESSIDEEEDMGFLHYTKQKPEKKREAAKDSRGRRDSKAAKHLKTWGIKFANDGKDDPQEYLDDLEACQRAENLEDEDIFKALYGTFSGEAKLWYRNEQHHLTSLREFRNTFRRRYMKVATHERLEEDLRGRKQGIDEDISTFMSCIKRILAEFRKPPRLEKQIQITFKNLMKDYRRYMIGKEISKLDDIVKYGREYEKILEWEEEDQNPRPAEKMLVKSAAYKPRKSVSKVAMAEEMTIDKVAENISKEDAEKKTKKNKKKEEQQVAVTTEQTKAEVQQKKPTVADNNVLMQQLITALRQMKNPSVRNNGQPPARPTTNYERKQTTTPAEAPGNCFVCNEEGHRAFNCPTRQCYTCQQPGHLANRCPTKAVKEEPQSRQKFVPKCAWCGEKGVVIKDCPTCAPFLMAMGNGAAEASSLPTSS